MTHSITENALLNYRESGSGTPLLLIHGYPFNSRIWERAEKLLAKDFHVIAPDLRGFRKSPPPEKNTVTAMETFADDLYFLLQKTGIAGSVIAAGLSMGGYVAMQLAAKYADVLKGIALCGTKTTADPPHAAENRRKQAASLRNGSLTLAALADEMIPKLFAAASEQHQPEIVRELRNIIIESEYPEGAAAAALGMAERTDTTEVLRQLNIPVLVVCGAEDRFTPPSEMRLLAETAQNSFFAEIAGAGHLPPMEQPETFAETFRFFRR